MNTQYLNEQIQVLQTALKQYDAVFDSFDRDITQLGKIANELNIYTVVIIDVLNEIAPGKFEEALKKRMEEVKQMSAEKENKPTSTEEKHIVLE